MLWWTLGTCECCWTLSTASCILYGEHTCICKMVAPGRTSGVDNKKDEAN